MNLRSFIKDSVLLAGSIIRRNRGSKILYYHDVYSSVNYKALDADVCMGTHIDLFMEHIDVIRSEGFEIVQNIDKPEGQVAIMFDDGFRGLWECRKYFIENKILPTVFLPIEYIGNVGKGIMSVDEILELQSYGFNFQCHGWSHGELTQYSDKELVRELGESKKRLSELLSKEITGICMPLGFFSDHLISKIREYGFTEIYSCLPGNFYDMPQGLITRNLCQDATSAEVRLILHGGNELLKSRYLKLHHKS